MAICLLIHVSTVTDPSREAIHRIQVASRGRSVRPSLSTYCKFGKFRENSIFADVKFATMT